ncbi:hypothetical protein NPS45_27405, partial [Pseudomonas putida]|uniref:hypothetical protein n=1 Tax=Pseudomonas putida TaxID=303 RepID=UPI00236494DE
EQSADLAERLSLRGMKPCLENQGFYLKVDGLRAVYLCAVCRGISLLEQYSSTLNLAKSLICSQYSQK